MKKNSSTAATTTTTSKMVGQEIMVTPEMAQQFLDTQDNNRHVNPKHVREIALNMLKGSWRRSPQPICFDVNGKLIDGQHRMLALIMANLTLPFFVVRNVPVESADHIDCGRPRNILDRLKIGHKELFWISQSDTSIANILSYCWRSMMPTQDEKAKWLLQHQEALMWIDSTYTAREHGFRKAAIRAAIMEAYENGVDQQLLIDLCNIMADPGQVAKSGDLAEQNFHQLRNYLVARAVRFNAGGGENKTVFKIVGQAIYETINGEKLSNLDQTERFPFKVVGIDGDEVYSPSLFYMKKKGTSKTGKVKKTPKTNP